MTNVLNDLKVKNVDVTEVGGWSLSSSRFYWFLQRCAKRYKRRRSGRCWVRLLLPASTAQRPKARPCLSLILTLSHFLVLTYLSILTISGQVFCLPMHVSIGLLALCFMTCISSPNLLIFHVNTRTSSMTKLNPLAWSGMRTTGGTPETARNLRTSFERFIELGPSPTLTGMVT